MQFNYSIVLLNMQYLFIKTLFKNDKITGINFKSARTLHYATARDKQNLHLIVQKFNFN